MTTFVERNARDLARRIIAAPGWASNLDGTIAGLGSLRASLTSECAADPGVFDPNRTATAILARAAAILREVATADPEVILSQYLNLLPADLRSKLKAGAIAALRDCGVTVEEYRDDNGEVFFHMTGLEAAGIPADVLEQARKVGPQPVGATHRVQ